MPSTGLYERIQQMYADEAGQYHTSGVLDVGPCVEDGKVWVWNGYGDQLKAGPFDSLAQAMQWAQGTLPDRTPFRRTRAFDANAPTKARGYMHTEMVPTKPRYWLNRWWKR